MRSRGFSLVELLLVLSLILLALALTLPAAARMLASSRMSAAALQLAAAFGETRWKSVATGRNHGLWFRRDSAGWYWLEVRDENANGLRSAELRRGTDAIVGGPYRLEHSVEHVRVGLPPLASIPAIPPRSGSLTRLADPIRFGRSDLISFSALGRSSSGTLFITDGKKGLVALVLYGPTARVRVWRYEQQLDRWSL